MSYSINMIFTHGFYFPLHEEWSSSTITSAYIIIALLSVVVLAICWKRVQNYGLDLPVVGHESETDFRAALEEGAEKVCRYRLSPPFSTIA